MTVYDVVTDEEIPQVVVGLVFSAAVFVAAFVFEINRLLTILTATAAAIACVVFAGMWWFIVARRRRERQDAAERKVACAYDGRADDRHALRLFFCEIEDEWGFLRELSEDQQHERVLLTHDEFLEACQRENKTYQEFRASSDFEIVLSELGPRAERTITLLQRRQQLYTWATAYITPAMRAEAHLRQSRAELQLRALEVAEFDRFEAALHAGDGDEDEPCDTRPILS